MASERLESVATLDNTIDPSLAFSRRSSNALIGGDRKHAADQGERSWAGAVAGTDGFSVFDGPTPQEASLVDRVLQFGQHMKERDRVRAG